MARGANLLTKGMTQGTSVAPRRAPVARFRIDRRTQDGAALLDDAIAVEEPLEIRVRYAAAAASRPSTVRSGHTIAVTMRTPGREADLAVGFLHGEGLIGERRDVLAVEPCATAPNVVHVTLAPHMPADAFAATRRFYTTSSCGLCGRSSLDAVLGTLRGRRVDGRARIAPRMLVELADRVRRQQSVFERTGGLHGAALATPEGELLDLAEDVGRHNAVDKVLGRAWLDEALPARDRVLFLSGRAGFELVQKAVLAGVSIVAAVGAPSSLAVELACEAELTLVGFVGAQSCNVYSAPERIGG